MSNEDGLMKLIAAVLGTLPNCGDPDCATCSGVVRAETGDLKLSPEEVQRILAKGPVKDFKFNWLNLPKVLVGEKCGDPDCGECSPSREAGSLGKGPNFLFTTGNADPLTDKAQERRFTATNPEQSANAQLITLEAELRARKRNLEERTLVYASLNKDDENRVLELRENIGIRIEKLEREKKAKQTLEQKIIELRPLALKELVDQMAENKNG